VNVNSLVLHRIFGPRFRKRCSYRVKGNDFSFQNKLQNDSLNLKFRLSC